SQLVLKIAAPGAPDFYQGSELWDFSLADPDNRRPVDFDERMRMLESMQTETVQPTELLKNWPDGKIKLYTTWMGLRLRRANPDLFLRGEYLPIRTTGFRAENVIAFARRLKNA